MHHRQDHDPGVGAFAFFLFGAMITLAILATVNSPYLENANAFSVAPIETRSVR